MKNILKWFMKHKYKIMICTGLLLTFCLFFKLIKLPCWLDVIIDIVSIIGSGVLCSAIVSWLVEKSNRKQKEETIKEQRKFILATLCAQTKSILSWEIRALSQYSHIRVGGERKTILIETTIEEGIDALKDILKELNQDIDSMYQFSKSIDLKYLERSRLKSAYLCKEVMPYYKAIHKTLVSVLENGSMYLLGEILNQKDIEILKDFEHIVECIIWRCESDDNSIILAYKKRFAKNLLLYFKCIGVDLQEKIEYGKETIEIENIANPKE